VLLEASVNTLETDASGASNSCRRRLETSSSDAAQGNRDANKIKLPQTVGTTRRERKLKVPGMLKAERETMQHDSACRNYAKLQRVASHTSNATKTSELK